MNRGITAKIRLGETEECVGGQKAVFLEVDESPGKLDEALVEVARRFAPDGQPEFLEDVVSLVVKTAIETGEEAEVVGIPAAALAGGDKVGDLGAFFAHAGSLAAASAKQRAESMEVRRTAGLAGRAARGLNHGTVRNGKLVNDSHLILGVDIGGTSIKAAVVDTRKGTLATEVARVKTPQPATPKAVVAALAELTRRLKWRGAVGVGFPGLIKQGVVRRAPNLDPTWVRHEIVDQLRRALGVTFVAVGNDADAAGLAEARFGAGRGMRGTVVLVTLGTGIGSAVLHNGSLLPDTELGHLEVGGQDAEKFASTLARERNKWTWEQWGGNVDRYLAVLEYMLAPDLFIIGGGVSSEPEKFFRYLETPECKIVPATMGNDAGIVGAALFAVRGVKALSRRRKRGAE